MTDWRTRGYVPDSDDEGESLSLRPSFSRDEAGDVDEAPTSIDANITTLEDVSPAPGPTNDQTTAQRLEQALSHGLQTIREVLSPSPPAAVSPEITSHEVDEDSPLSSLSSSIAGSPRRIGGLDTSATQSEHELGASQDVTGDVVVQNAPRRNLRARAPIQQHPYMLENAMYRQQLQARGVRPVNVPSGPRQQGREEPEDESQQSAEFQSSQMEESHNLTNLSSPVRSSMPQQGISTPDLIHTASDEVDDVDDDDDDGLPDLSSLLQERSRTSKKTYKPNRRTSRAAAPPIPVVPTSAETSDLSAGGDADRGNLLRRRDFQVPPSPPHSDRLLGNNDGSDSEGDIPLEKSNRRPKTPSALPTPILSSDHGHRKRPVTIIESSESSQSEDDGDISTTSSEAEEDDSQGLRWIRQKLKGVLPPSFLKIDIQPRVSNRSKQQPVPSPVTPVGIERGVARRTSARTPHTSSLRNTTDISLLESESSDAEDPQDVTTQSRNLPRSALPIAINLDDDDSHVSPVRRIVEEDEVDRMLPSTRRPRDTAGNVKSRQTRIDSGWAVKNRRSAIDAAAAGLTGQNLVRTKVQGTKSTPGKRQKVRHKRQSKPMSVLDAPGLQEMERDAQPQFLKVAARRAKSSADQELRAQPKKFFRLATESDTKDVNDQMDAWKRTKSRRKPSDAIALRTHTHSANDQRPAASSTQSSTPFTSASALRELKQSTNLLLSKVSSHRSSLQQKSSSDDIPAVDLTTQDSSRVQTLALRARFAHRNRSGQGQLLARQPEPRAAQLEQDLLSASIMSQSLPRTLVKTIHKPGTISRAIERQSKIMAQGQSKDSERPRGVRKPRKQVPKRSTIPTAKMDLSDPLDAPDRKIPVIEKELATLPVLAAVDALRLPAINDSFRSSTVSNDYLRLAAQRAALKSHNPFAVVNHISLISTPASNQYLQCGMYTDEVRLIISTTLDEVFEILRQHPDTDQTTCRKCVLSLSYIIHYLGFAAHFKDTTSIESLVQSTGVWVEMFLDHFANKLGQFERTMRETMLECLNRLVLITLFLHDLANHTSLELGLSEKTRDLCLRIVNGLIATIYDHAILERVLPQLEMFYYEPRPFWLKPESFPEADSIIIGWQTYQALSEDHSTKHFYEHIKSVLAVEDNPNRTNQLRLCLLALCFTLPLAVMNLQGSVMRDISLFKDFEGTCFNLLAEHVEGIIRGPKSSTASDIVGPLLEAVEDVCLKMANAWGWTPTPTIITALWQAYVWNSWLPFHTVTDPSAIFENLKLPSHAIEYSADNDFYKFLNLIELCINGMCRPRLDGMNGAYNATPSKVRSLVFKLLPNSVESFEAHKPIPVDRLLALKNMFALRVKIFTIVPEGAQPRLQDLKDYVDFSTSHGLVCKLATAAWKSITMFYVEREASHPGMVSAAGEWMESILRQSIAYLNKNCQAEAISRLEDVLLTWTHVVKHCEDETQARKLFFTDPIWRQTTNGLQVRVDEIAVWLVETLLSMPERYQHNEAITISAVRLLLAYARTIKTTPIKYTLADNAQLMLKNIIRRFLNSDRNYSQVLVRLVMETWFVIAHAMVKDFHKNWHNFLEPSQDLSIDFLSGLRHTYRLFEVKACFFSDLVRADPNFYFLECRPIVFITWVATLLFPIQRMRLEHLLTNTILTLERDSLMIKDLTSELFHYDQTREFDVQQLANCRFAIISHIIRNIHVQREDPEEEWLAGGLDFHALTELLRTMTRTMKEVWLDLSGQPDIQNDYTTLVHAVLNEMETYPVPGFRIDPWFTGNSSFPALVRTFDNTFKCPFGEKSGDIDEELIHSFVQQYKHAIDSNRHDDLICEWLQFFNCTDRLRRREENGVVQYSIDIAKQEKLLQIVVPVFFRHASLELQNPFLDLLLKLLINFMACVRHRIDKLSPVTMDDHVSTMAAIICAARKFLENTHTHHISTPLILNYTRHAMGWLFILIEEDIPIDKALIDCCVGNIMGIYQVVIYHLPSVLEDHERDPTVQRPERQVSEVDEVADDVDRSNTVFQSHGIAPVENFELVPDEMSWTLQAELLEPALKPEEERWRAKTLWDLHIVRGCPESMIRSAVGPCADMEELRHEMLEFLRDLKRRDLVDREVVEWDEESGTHHWVGVDEDDEDDDDDY